MCAYGATLLSFFPFLPVCRLVTGTAHEGLAVRAETRAPRTEVQVAGRPITAPR